MLHFCRILAFALVVLPLAAGQPFAQDEQVRRTLFQDAADLLQQAGENQAQVLAPSSYGKAMRHFRDAESAFERGRGLEGIQKDLTAAQSWFKLSLAAAKQARVTFARALAARANAQESEAPRHAAQAWERAEEKLIEGARKLEDGDKNSAVQRGMEAEVGFRAAEVEALKVTQLSPTWKLLDQAEREDVKDYAPATLKSAQDLLNLAEIKLKQTAEVTDEIRTLSRQAEDTARRSLIIADRVKNLAENNVTLEQIVVTAEDRLLRIANAAGTDVTFEARPEDVVEAVVARLADRQAERIAMADSLARLEAEYNSLRKGATSMEARLARQKRIRERVDAVNGLFHKDEATVLRAGRDIVVRLHGLNFGVGRAVIEPESFALLARVQEAIRLAEGTNVTVEGHTDSHGSEEANLALSTRRAEAVLKYLKADTNAGKVHIQAVGHGEMRPVASNDTKEGRARNRRIDVVISIPAEGT